MKASEDIISENKRLEAESKRLNMALCVAETALDNATRELAKAREIVKMALGRG